MMYAMLKPYVMGRLSEEVEGVTRLFSSVNGLRSFALRLIHQVPETIYVRDLFL
jgi:hypothetical protein